MSGKYIIGIDEVGRGCLAGPVVVVAFAIPLKLKIKNKISKLKDSKQLTETQREQWLEHIKNHPEMFYRIARVSPTVIDRINISAAANRAAYRAFNRLVEDIPRDSSIICFLDGGLYLKNRKHQEANYQKAKTVVKGDEKFDSVKLASIAAKVIRDRYMKRLHKEHPHYGFDVHKGYGTKRHYAAIKKHGVSDAHRLTFLKEYPNI